MCVALQNAEHLSAPSSAMAYSILDDPFVESYNIPSARVFDRWFDCPLDHVNAPFGRSIRVFARHVVHIEKVNDMKKMPFLLFLQGGPGFECRFPVSANGGWLKIVLDKGFQVLLLDQRGTGLSEPISNSTLTYTFHDDDAKKADYLRLFRADSIVRDCEVIRKKLTKGRQEDEAESRITLLGQSFGGFCIVTYLSLFPNSIKQAFITGGVPPLVSHPDPVYLALYPRILKRNHAYYAKYPQDVARVREIVAYLTANPTFVPNGGNLTARRFLQLGIQFGFNGGYDAVHQIILHVARDISQFGMLQYKTLDEVQAAQSWDTNVIYALLHEQIYAQEGGGATGWSAEKIREETWWRHEFEYRWEVIEEEDKAKGEKRVVNFTGETIYPWMFDDYAELRPHKKVAQLLAQYDGWGPLYNLEQLRKNTVPVAGVSYYDDMYVDIRFSEQAAETIQGFQQWITNEYTHSGLRDDPDRIVNYLFKLVRGDVDR